MSLKIKNILRLAEDSYEQVQIIDQRKVLFAGEIFYLPNQYSNYNVITWSVEENVLILQV